MFLHHSSSLARQFFSSSSSTFCSAVHSNLKIFKETLPTKREIKRGNSSKSNLKNRSLDKCLHQSILLTSDPNFQRGMSVHKERFFGCKLPQFQSCFSRFIAHSSGKSSAGENLNPSFLSELDKQRKLVLMPDNLYEYLLGHNDESQILRKLRARTKGMPGAQMQILPEQGTFLSLLISLMNAKRCIEVGVFTGYSSLCVALTLSKLASHSLSSAKEPLLVACDKDVVTLSVAQEFYKEAGVDHIVEVRQGDALVTLNKLLKEEEGLDGSFDFAFLDADKRNYDNYFELLIKLLRPGGLLVVDNVLWYGKVANEEIRDKTTVSLRLFNKKVTNDSRVQTSMVAIGDGLLLCYKL